MFSDNINAARAAFARQPEREVAASFAARAVAEISRGRAFCAESAKPLMASRDACSGLAPLRAAASATSIAGLARAKESAQASFPAVFSLSCAKVARPEAMGSVDAIGKVCDISQGR